MANQRTLTVAISGDDTVQINNQVLTTLANQNPGHVTFPNEMVTVDQGKNGTTIYAQNNMGFIADMTIRLILSGYDDKYLNSLLQEEITNFSGQTLMSCVFTKRVGDGAGNISSVIYQLSGGQVLKGVEAITSARGDSEQSVAVWPIRFGNWTRIIA